MKYVSLVLWLFWFVNEHLRLKLTYHHHLPPPSFVRLSAFPALVMVLVVYLEPVTDFVLELAIVIEFN